jgi:hypothetical protein
MTGDKVDGRDCGTAAYVAQARHRARWERRRSIDHAGHAEANRRIRLTSRLGRPHVEAKFSMRPDRDGLLNLRALSL